MPSFQIYALRWGRVFRRHAYGPEVTGTSPKTDLKRRWRQKKRHAPTTIGNTRLMFIATLLANPARMNLDRVAVESLRDAWGGGTAL